MKKYKNGGFQSRTSSTSLDISRLTNQKIGKEVKEKIEEEIEEVVIDEEIEEVTEEVVIDEEFKYENKYNRICNDIHLKKIPLASNNKFLHTYNKSNNETNNELFKNLNKNNNGIISDKSIILQPFNEIKGGKKIKGGEKINEDKFREALIKYLKAYKKLNTAGLSDDDAYLNENNYMKKFIENKFSFDGTDIPNIIPEDLAKFIEDNTKDTEFFLEINLNKKYTYNMNAVHSYDNNYNIKLRFDHMHYNEDIVKAFEDNFIENEDIRQNFIAKQNSFIEGLTRKNKIIINDYTKKRSFKFYSYYITKDKDTEWFEKYKDIDEAFCFGDSFYFQIWKKYPAKFIATLNISDEYFLPFKPTNQGIVASRLKQTAVYTVHDFNNYWKHVITRETFKAVSKFKDILTKKEWEEVLAEFIKDVNHLILSSPELEDDLYCYRGVSNHYIHGGNSAPSSSNIFVSTRLSSFSLNFDKSYEYYNSEPDPNKCIYKTIIKKGVNVLFIPKLSLATDEIEILTPLDTLIIYETNDSGVSMPLYTCYNNRHKKYGICSFNDEFNCAYVLIDKTPGLELHYM